MSSLILAQRPKNRPAPVKPDLEVRIASVESTVTHISLSKKKPDRNASSIRPFDFDVNMSETGRTDDSLSVKYVYSYVNISSGQVCKVGGAAVVRFSQFNPDSDFRFLGNDITNEIAVEIFRKNYESLYLLHDALAMTAPSPWITQDVSLSSRVETEVYRAHKSKHATLAQTVKRS
jgi:hypothetical protein